MEPCTLKELEAGINLQLNSNDRHRFLRSILTFEKYCTISKNLFTSEIEEQSHKAVLCHCF